MNTNNEGSTPEFDDFMASGEVEVGSEVAAEKEKPAKRRGPPKAAAKAEINDDDNQSDDDDAGDDDGQSDDGDEGHNDDNQSDDGDAGDETDDDKPKRTPKESQIDRLKREKAAANREARELRRRLDAIETGELARRLENIEKGLKSENTSDNPASGKPAPDPSDADKYPLGHLDDRYIEDKLEWLAEKKAAERADAVLQRQQENEQRDAEQQRQRELLDKVDDLSARGSELYEDFHESVVESGMKGEWDLSQTTFEAACDADHGVQILHELAQDRKEAARVAKLSPIQQLKFVLDRDAEISKSKSPRRIPQAGDPPKNTPRGANSRTHINPGTDNLDDFEKAWAADAKAHSR